ncbi:MAG: benzoate-CoA ligase family protein [Acidobacteria bacterium]|nr:benzoate-CoA ligase family protein [Acidobacteriota bacterium]
MNLVEYLFKAAVEGGRLLQPAIVFEGRRVSYGELARQVGQFGHLITAELGVKAGERVAIASRDCPEFVIAFMGSAAVGALAVPVSTMLTAAELAYVLDHCGARVLVASSDQLEKLQSIRSGLAQLSNVLLVDGEADGASNLQTALAGAGEAEILDVAADAPAFILYTSGSTGPPKGAVHVHGNLPYTVEHCCKHVLRVRTEDRLFSSSKLFFAYGLGNSLSFPLGSGATAILCKDRPTPPVVAGVFERHRPTVFFGVPAVYRSLIEHRAQGGALDTSSVKLCVSAGERLPESIFREWKELTGLDILDGIGSTEMLQMFITNTRERIKPGSSGQPVPGYEAKLLDAQGRDIEGAGTGSLLVKGGSASPGYWRDPEKTAATMLGDWMLTGDIYRRDDEGFYWFEGRGDDLFKVKGLWVSPVEVEDALLSCPGVLEAAVVPRASEDGMNRVAAFVVLKSGETAGASMEDELKARVRALLPSHKRPSQIYFLDELPRTATGKLQRFKLRDQPST